MQRVVVDLKQRKVMGASADSFIEEAVVRKELSDNFCYYNKQYDSIDGCSDWAKESLALHASDPREHIYSRDQFAKAQTHDDLWNAAQVWVYWRCWS